MSRPLVAVAALLILAGCGSRESRADRAASEAQTFMLQGNLFGARQRIRDAIDLRDDVSDYWLLLGRIALQANDPRGAFDAYSHVTELDRSNVEALNILGQLGLSTRQPDKVDKTADQLLLLNPDNMDAVLMKAGAALQRGEEEKAILLVDQVLARSPNDANALVLKGRVLLAQNKQTEATALIEDSLKAGGDPIARLSFLRDTYAGMGDRVGYGSALSRLIAAIPKEPNLQLDEADFLYSTDRPEPARRRIVQVMQNWPNDIRVSARIVEIWRDSGAAALPLDQQLVAMAAPQSLQMRSAFAQYANDRGRPDLVVPILGPVMDTIPIDANTADAKAAYAYSFALQGQAAKAMTLLNAILAFDPEQPRALLARANVLASANKLDAAISDVRRVIADDPTNVSARITLADLLLRRGDATLANAAWREATDALPREPRIANGLARFLIARGQRSAAGDVVRNLTRATPIDVRAWRTRAAICTIIGDASCAAGAQAAIKGRPAIEKPVDI